MITFKINGTRFKIPTCWQDVTYWQYIELLKHSTLRDQISIFTGIERSVLYSAELRNFESIAESLSFLQTPPPFDSKPTMLVGPYTLPRDITLLSVGQFESLHELMAKGPKKIEKPEDHFQMNDLYLEACAIYVQKLEDGEYDNTRVPKFKEQLKAYSCVEVINTGSFFLFRPLNSFLNTRTRSRSITQRLKKLIQDFPGYQKTLDSLQRSLGSQKE